MTDEQASGIYTERAYRAAQQGHVAIGVPTGAGLNQNRAGQGGIYELTSMLHQKLSMLNDALGELEQRLVPVLSQAPPEKNLQSAQLVAGSQLKEELSSANNRLLALTDVVRGMTARLEL